MQSWNTLPDELGELVLAQLPISEISRLRSVCSDWYTTVSSPQFRRLYKQLHPRTNPSLFLYDHQVKISSWQASDCTWRDFNLPTFYVRDWVGGGGLVCLRSHLLTQGYLVGNPVTGAWREVPKPPDSSVEKIWAIVTDATHRSYRIILSNKITATVQIYSSDTEEWTRKAVPQSVVGNQSFSLDSVLSSSATSIGELVYSIHGETRSVIVFDVRRDIWKRVEAPLPAGLAFQILHRGYVVDTPPKLVEGAKGKILMVGGLLEGGGDEAMGRVGVVWELERGSKAWREVGRAPLEMWNSMLEEAKEMRKPVLLPVRYAGEGGLIVVMACGSSRAITFDLVYETWNWLDLPPTSNCDLSFCFQPSTEAQV